MVGSWVGIGEVCCEVGVSEMAEAWDHSLEKMEGYCHSLEQEIILGFRCRTEEGESASQEIERIYFGDLKDWSNLFHMTILPPLRAHDCMQQSFLLMEMW